MDVTIEKTGDEICAHLAGRFDLKSHSSFDAAMAPLLDDSGFSTIRLDFERVPFMDSSALGMLLALRRRAQAANKTIILSRCGRDVQRVLSVAHFSKIFRIE